MMEPATVIGFFPLHGICCSPPSFSTVAAMRLAAMISLLP
jgi:hypothetical protein